MMNYTRNKRGFTLIEMMVAILITSLLGSILTAIYVQTQRSVSRINETIDLDFADSIIYNQMEKDLSGIFVPQLFVDDRSSESKKAQPGQPKQPQGQPAKPGQKPKPKKKLERAKNALVSMGSSGNLSSLSFITNNPMQVYGQSKPRIVRVEYALEPDKIDSKMFNLVRRQSLEFELEKFKASEPRPYTLATNVKSMTVEFFAAKEEEKDKKKNQKKGGKAEPTKEKQGEQEKGDKKEEKKAPELISLTEWNDEVSKNNKEINPDFLPLYIKVELVLRLTNDSDSDATRTYTFYYHIYAYESGVVVQPKLPKPPKPLPPPKSPGGGKGGPPRSPGTGSIRPEVAGPLRPPTGGRRV